MKSKKLITLAATGALVLTPLGLLPAPAAQAAGAGAFSVQVREWGSGSNLSGIQVSLFSTATGAKVGTSLTTPADDPATPGNEATGTVEFTGLDDGTYTALAQDPTKKYAEGYTTTDTITASDQWAYGDVRLRSNTLEVGALTGTLTEDGTDTRLRALVEVFPASATQASVESGTVDPVAAESLYDYDYYDDALSDDWSLQVPGGQAYKVRISDRDTPGSQWIGPDGATASTATSFTVAKGKTVPTGTRHQASEDATTSATRVSGTVTGPGGIKLDDVEVELFKKHTHNGQSTWIEVDSDYTGSNGTFAFDFAYSYEWDEDNQDWEYSDWGPLTAGTYTLRYRDDDGEYATKFLGNVDPAADTSAVPAGVGEVALDATGKVTASFALTTPIPLATTSGIHGTVTDDLGKAHRGYVSVHDLLGNEVDGFSTRRNGTWSVPATDLPPGQYKVNAYGEDLVGSWYGGKSFRTAKVITVPVKGAANAGGSALARLAKLSGTIAMPALPGAERRNREVTIYAANGRQVANHDVGDTGAFSFVVAPGTYYLSADGHARSHFDSSSAGVSHRDFIEQFWKGAYSLAAATPIRVGSGGKASGLNLTLGNKLLPTAAPRISGTAKVGKTLSVSTGAWNVTEDLAFTIVWKRNGATVSTRSSYTLVKADAGKSLTATVTAKDKNAEYTTGAANSATVKVAKVKKPKKKKAKKKGKSKK